MIMPKLPKLELLFETIPWKSFKCSKKQLRIDIVLKCGQSFRWEEEEHNTSDLRTWTGVLQSKVWQIAQDDTRILYRNLGNNALSTSSSDQDETFLKDYFQLEVDLEPLYAEWAKNDPVFQKISETFGGVRILRQDPVENLFAFICSSNNNIQRISGMVQQLCTKYGEYIGQIDNKSYFTFPEISTLANQKRLESELRSLGFGYRAGYISKTAMKLDSLGGREYLLSLRHFPYTEARKCLLDLSGIGPKVADCILLMSLDQHEAIPVDTHMFQIASQKYLPHLKQYKSVTDKVYMEIADHFRKLYGNYSGWAHSVLFSADLRHFQSINENGGVNTSTSNTKKSRKRKASK